MGRASAGATVAGPPSSISMVELEENAFRSNARRAQPAAGGKGEPCVQDCGHRGVQETPLPPGHALIQTGMALQYSAGPPNQRRALQNTRVSQSMGLPLATTRGPSRARTSSARRSCVSRHGSQRRTRISSRQGIAAPGSRCPPRPLSARPDKVRRPARGGPNSARAAAHGLGPTPTAPGKAPLKAACGRARTQAVDGGVSGRPPGAPPAGLGRPVQSGNVPEAQRAAGGGESPRCRRNPARRSVAADEVPPGGESRAKSTRADEIAPPRTRTRGRTLVRRPG